MGEDKRNRNPLRILWNTIGTVGGIISLSSMVDSWLDDLLKWKGFISSIIQSYRSITMPISDFLFGWLPWSMPLWITDYLILGILYAASHIRGLDMSSDDRFVTTLKEIHEGGGLLGVTKFILLDVTTLILFMVILNLWLVITWPKMLFGVIGAYISTRRKDNNLAHWYGTEPRDVCLWFGAILLGFVVLLAINATL